MEVPISTVMPGKLRLDGIVAQQRVEPINGGDKIGCIRDFRLRNGDRIREKLLGLSDFDLFCTYSILESPLGVRNYIATLLEERYDVRLTRQQKWIEPVVLEPVA